MNMGANAIIQTVGLTKIYGIGAAQVRALEAVDLTITENEFVAIMGPSGSGKSTMMNILGCLDRPTEGRYFLVGEDVSNFNRNQLAAIRNQRIGFVFQSYNLLSQTTALENVMLPLLYSRLNPLPESKQKEKAMAALEAVGLSDRLEHRTQELSGGQAQRVAVARALVNDPMLILADEPTGNLDSHSGKELMMLIKELHTKGSTIIIVTHDDEIASYAGRIIHFKDGCIETDHVNGSSSSGAS